MFEDVSPVPPDPLLGIMAEFAQDPNPNKVDLGVGEYKQEDGLTPIFECVKEAEARLLKAQKTKGYVGPTGSKLYNDLIAELMFGKDHPAVREQRIARAQTPGGSAALRVGMELIKRRNPDATVWLSQPTWSNHEPIIRATGLRIASYPYYDMAQSAIDFDGMLQALNGAVEGDIVLLHASCHNPAGADLNQQQWQAVTEAADARGFIAFIDMAYQGFGNGIDEDAYGLRLFAQNNREVLVANSCSKNFGIYRERTGTLGVVVNNSEQAAAITTHMNQISRGMYSMPPAHGASIVETLLSDPKLTQQWQIELKAVRGRMTSLRNKLADSLNAALGSDRFSFIKQQKGMFSFLGITPEQIKRLKDEYAIYMAGTSRINIAGLNANNIDYVAAAVAKVIQC